MYCSPSDSGGRAGGTGGALAENERTESVTGRNNLAENISELEGDGGEFEGLLRKRVRIIPRVM